MNIVVVAERCKPVWELECLRKLGVGCRATTCALEWKFADALILPADLKRTVLYGKTVALRILIEDCQVPVLGIDNGMHLLMDDTAGLGILPGKIKPLEQPHKGWNDVIPKNPGVFEGIGKFSAFFCHSHYCEPKDRRCVAAVTKYSTTTFPSALVEGNISAIQFRLDKSGEFGIRMLERFLKRAKR